MRVNKTEWEVVYKLPDTGTKKYLTYITALTAEDATQVFKKEHPNAIRCGNAKRCSIKLFPINKEQCYLQSG